MKRAKVLVIVSLCIAFLVTPGLSAQTASQELDAEVGISLGIWLPGTILIEGYDVDKDGSLLLRLIADYYVAPRLAVGAYFNTSSGKLEESVAFSTWEIGMAFKPRFVLSDELALKPGLGIGYRSGVAKYGGYSSPDIDGFAVNGGVELQYHLGTGPIPFVELGFLSQPVGGTSQIDIVWAPIFYLSAGVGYGF
jgi:hypothetical protein